MDFVHAVVHFNVSNYSVEHCTTNESIVVYNNIQCVSLWFCLFLNDQCQIFQSKLISNVILMNRVTRYGLCSCELMARSGEINK